MAAKVVPNPATKSMICVRSITPLLNTRQNRLAGRGARTEATSPQLWHVMRGAPRNPIVPTCTSPQLVSRRFHVKVVPPGLAD
jgi:hypothetical protein